MKSPQINVVMAAPKKARLEIYDDIGPAWAGMIDPKAVSRELAKHGEIDEIEVRVNSRGGSAFDGLGIATLLNDHPAKKIGVVEGIAASAATLPLMVCQSVRIPKNALFMIHDPAAYVFGGEKDLKAAIGMLAAGKKAAIALYATKSGKSEQEISDLMAAETWYTGDEAVAAKFADATEQAIEADKAPNKEQVSLSLKEARGLPGLVVLTVVSQSEDALVADTPKPAATPVANEVALTQADVDAAAAKQAKSAVEGERQRAADLSALCKMAGKPEKAQGYIESGATVEQARKEMYEALCQERKPHADGGSAGDAPPKPDPNAKFKAEFKANPHFATRMSEDEYVASRRVDEGLDSLKQSK